MVSWAQKQYSHLLQWRQDGRDGVSNHQSLHRLLNGLFRLRSKKASKLHVTGLFARNSPVTGEFPAKMASNVKNVSIWWRHHVLPGYGMFTYGRRRNGTPLLLHRESNMLVAINHHTHVSTPAGSATRIESFLLIGLMIGFAFSYNILITFTTNLN